MPSSLVSLVAERFGFQKSLHVDSWAHVMGPGLLRGLDEISKAGMSLGHAGDGSPVDLAGWRRPDQTVNSVLSKPEGSDQMTSSFCRVYYPDNEREILISQPTIVSPGNRGWYKT